MFNLEAYKQVKLVDIDIQNQKNVSYGTWTFFFQFKILYQPFFKYFQYFVKAMYMSHLLKNINFLHVQIVIKKFQAQCVLGSNQDMHYQVTKVNCHLYACRKICFGCHMTLKKKVTYFYIYSKNIVALNAQQGSLCLQVIV